MKLHWDDLTDREHIAAGAILTVGSLTLAASDIVATFAVMFAGIFFYAYVNMRCQRDRKDAMARLTGRVLDRTLADLTHAQHEARRAR